MENYGASNANANPSMMGVAETGGDNATSKPEDPKGPESRTLMTESEQSAALAAGCRAAKMFPSTPDKAPDTTYE